MYVFDKFGNLSDEKESITELSKSLNISYSILKKKLKSGRSVNGLFISTSSILQIDKYLFIYNPINNRFLLFSTIQEVLSFLNISNFVYKKLEKSKSSKDGWLINTVTEINNSKLTLTKNGIDYEFFSVKEAASFIGCVVFAIYDLLKGKTKSIYNFKLKEQ